ncbi:pirin family protein [Methylobacterium sp. CM6241]
MIRKATRTTKNAIDSGQFSARAYFPGHLAPGNKDHGLGPLATIMESFLAPGTHIKLHEHVVDEIVSWVPAGVMRHDDPEGDHLTIDADHLMVMNAGRGFQHEERTRNDDPPLRMLQIFVRPYAEGLDPGIQHGRLPEPHANEWRHVFGPSGDEAPFQVRNAVDCRDIRLAAGQTTSVPTEPGRTTYFFVFTGCVAADGQTFDEAESGLAVEGGDIRLEANADAVVLAFVIDANAQVCRGGTVGDGETVHRMGAQALR